MFKVFHCNWEPSLTRNIHQPKENKQPNGCDAQLAFGGIVQGECPKEFSEGNVWGFVGDFLEEGNFSPGNVRGNSPRRKCQKANVWRFGVFFGEGILRRNVSRNVRGGIPRGECPHPHAGCQVSMTAAIRSCRMVRLLLSKRLNSFLLRCEELGYLADRD